MNKVQVVSFIGMSSYFHHMVKALSIKTRPLAYVAHEGIPIDWSECQDKAYKEVVD